MAFKKGHEKTGGRSAGSQNKLTKTVKEAVEAVFSEMQQDTTKTYSLKAWAEKNPKDFYLIAAKLIPLQMDVKGEITTIKVIRGG